VSTTQQSTQQWTLCKNTSCMTGTPKARHRPLSYKCPCACATLQHRSLPRTTSWPAKSCGEQKHVLKSVTKALAVAKAGRQWQCGSNRAKGSGMLRCSCTPQSPAPIKGGLIQAGRKLVASIRHTSEHQAAETNNGITTAPQQVGSAPTPTAAGLPETICWEEQGLVRETPHSCPQGLRQSLRKIPVKVPLADLPTAYPLPTLADPLPTCAYQWLPAVRSSE